MENDSERTLQENYLKEQLVITRAELKNIRQQLFALKKSHQKDVEKIKKVINASNTVETWKAINQDKDAETPESWSQIKPIGHVQSLFKFKNGTPRQPTVCGISRATLTIEKSVFNNPKHSLEGLEDFSHVWILFVFHLNNNSYSKSKVKPPRLDGEKVGLFSTRCPYRPNPIGLTLAKIEKIEGATLYLSGVDIVDGTPVVDIKPYIPDYDQPCIPKSGEESAAMVHEKLPPLSTGISVGQSIDVSKATQGDCTISSPLDLSTLAKNHKKCSQSINNIDTQAASNYDGEKEDSNSISKKGENCELAVVFNAAQSIKHGDKVAGASSQATEHNDELIAKRADEFTASQSTSRHNELTEAQSTGQIEESTGSQSSIAHIATWISEPCVKRLTVVFTQRAKEQLTRFNACVENVEAKLSYLKCSEELQDAIVSILSEDPRSTYRRKKCSDDLYFFTVDTAHVTCWFDKDIITVLRVKPIGDVHLESTVKRV